MLKFEALRERISDAIFERVPPLMKVNPPISPRAETTNGMLLFPGSNFNIEDGIRGIGGVDIYKAFEKGYVKWGDKIAVHRPDNIGEQTLYQILAYIDPGAPVVDRKTGKVGHIFFDPNLKIESSVSRIDDIVMWEHAGKDFSREQTVRLYVASRRYREEKRKQKEISVLSALLRKVTKAS